MELYLDSLVYVKKNFYIPEPQKRKFSLLVDLTPKRGDNSKFHQSTWTRLTMPIHAALLLIRAVSCQTIRGTGSIIAGVLTIDRFKIGSGFKDYFSMLVQVVALPIIGITAPFSPNKAHFILKTFLSHSFEQTLDPKKSHGRKVQDKLKNYFVSQSSNGVSRGITGLVRGILVGIPVTIIDGLTTATSSLLRGRINFRWIIMNCAARPVGSLLISLFAGFEDSAYELVTGFATNDILFE